MAPAVALRLHGSLFVVDVVSVATNGDVHAKADAHVRILVEPILILIAIAIAVGVGVAVATVKAGSIDITIASLGVVGFETLIVLVFDVSVGSLNGDVHTFADGRVGEVVSG